MSHQLTLELPDPLFERISGVARTAGQTPEEWALRRLASAVPSPQDRAEAVSRLLKHAGAATLPSATGTDNESIDEDLADEAIGSDGERM